MESSRDDLKGLWKEAVEEYVRETEQNPNLITTKRASGKIETVTDVVAQIQASEAEFSAFRQKNERLYQALNVFVAPISAIANIAVTPASVVDCGTASSAVLGAVVYLLRACDGVSSAYDWVEQLFRELQDFSERLAQYVESPQLDPILRRKIIAILAVLLKVIGRSQKLIRERRFREYLRVTFLGKDSTTKKLIDELNRTLESEQRYTVGVTYATTQRIEEVVKATDEKVNRALENIKADRDKKASAEDESQFRNTLSGTSAPADVEEIFVRNERALLQGTGTWLENEIFFRSWMHREAAILWIFGGPGSGKSFLSTRLIQLLRETNEDDDPVAYFFVKENNENLRDANIILKTLAWQIATQDEEFRKHALTVCRERSRTITADLTWENLFLGYYSNPNSTQGQCAVTIVIDGLDEATTETRETILGLLKEFVLSSARSASNPGQSGIRLAVIGRGSLRSDMDLKRFERNYFIEVSRTKNRDDIDSYIRKRLEELEILQEMRKMKPGGLKKANKVGSKIMKKVAEGADGVFLWAKLLLDSFVKKDLPQIEAILTSPPATLDEMIWSVFDRLARDEELDQVVLRKMLMFMAHARRPLLFGELDIVTSLPSRKPNYLLWKHTRGELSSVFDLRFPDDNDPDDDDVYENESGGDEEEEEQRSIPGGTDSVANDDQAFSFSYDDRSGDENSDDDSNENADSDDDDISSQPASAGFWTDKDEYSKGNEENNDLLSHISGGKQRTSVAFCHTRIRDFLVREGNPKTRRNRPLPIVPGVDDVQADITIACLDMFRLGLSLDKDQRFLCDYPLCHLPFHLEGTNRDNVPPEKAAKIIEGLYWLLGTSKGAQSLISATIEYDEFHSSRTQLWNLWVGTDRYLHLVQSWLGSAPSFRDHMSACDDDRVNWMLGASKSLECLLQPVIKSASNQWLTRPGHATMEYMDKGEFFAVLVHGWLTMIETGAALPDSPPYWTGCAPPVTAERIEQLANYAGLAHDTHWHTLLGWTLMLANHYESAMTHYREAVSLDSHAWVALEGLARSAGEQEQHADAIEWQEKAIDALPPEMYWVSAYLWPRITEWANGLGDHDKAFESAVKGFQAEPTSNLAVTTMFYELRNREMSAEIMDALHILNSTPSPEGIPYNLLVRLFVHGEDVFWDIGWACAKEGRPTFVLDALDKALKIVNDGDREWIQLWLPYMSGRMKYTFFGLEEDAVLYFDAAVQSLAKDPSTRPASADKLKQLAVEVSTGFTDDYEGFDLFRADYPAMLWGRWLRDYKGADEAKWRKCFRARLLEELNTIDDNDPTNDSAGLKSLAVSLFHAGDRANAGAIMAILFREISNEQRKEKTEDSSVEPSTDDNLRNDQEPSQTIDGEPDEVLGSDGDAAGEGPVGASESEQGDKPEEAADSVPSDSPNGQSAKSAEEPRRDPGKYSSKDGNKPEHVLEEEQHDLKLNVEDDIAAMSYRCHNCSRNVSEAAEMYACEVCSETTNWCERCLPLLQDDQQRQTMVYHMCNPRHTFYHAWPVPEEAKHVAAGSFENGVSVRREWLKNLRQNWWE